MPFFGRVALSMLFSIKNCTCMQILVTSSKNADMLLIPPVRNWTISQMRTHARNGWLTTKVENVSQCKNLTFSFAVGTDWLHLLNHSRSELSDGHFDASSWASFAGNHGPGFATLTVAFLANHVFAHLQLGSLSVKKIFEGDSAKDKLEIRCKLRLQLLPELHS